jgi:diguanylate cyclase (GGDEF)-like protein
MHTNKNLVQNPSATFRLFKTGLIVTFVVLVALTLGFIYQERASLVRSDIQQRLATLTLDSAETLRLSVENLQAASSVLVYFRDISFAQFKGVVGRYFESDAGLLIMEWQPVVPESERVEFVQNARLRGLWGFRLWEPDERGNPVPAQARDQHVPVYFMLKRDLGISDQGTIGLDLAWSAERMESKWAARDLGRAQASGLFKVITGPTSDYQPVGVAITLPIYRNGYVPNNITDRKSDLLGYMAGVYSIEDLFKPHIDDLKSAGFNLIIHDEADNENRLSFEGGISSTYEDDIQLDLYGNSLHFRLIATKKFVDNQFNLLWILLPLALALFGSIIFAFLHHLEKKTLSLSNAQVELEGLNSKLKDLSIRDPLTGLLNRRGFIENLELELVRLQRHPESIALLILDLDHFKNVNDRWGHPAGDKVLIEFANALNSFSRNTDRTGRLGGEEFAILLVKNTREEAIIFTERLRKKISELQITLSEDGESISITASIGFSVINQAMSADRLIEQADKALYLAKNQGRNCVREFDHDYHLT